MTEAARLQALVNAQNDYILALEEVLKEAIDRTPHSAENPLHKDPHLAKIVDHNARVTGHLGGGNRVSLDHIKAGRELVDAAKAAGHHGLRVDWETGHVVPFDSHETRTYLGSHYQQFDKDPVRAWSKPHKSESGEHHWGQHTENGWGMGPF